MNEETLKNVEADLDLAAGDLSEEGDPIGEDAAVELGRGLVAHGRALVVEVRRLREENSRLTAWAEAHRAGETVPRTDYLAMVKDRDRLRDNPALPERVKYEMRMIYLHLTPNLGGEPNAEGVDRARARMHGLIMEFGNGEFLT